MQKYFESLSDPSQSNSHKPCKRPPRFSVLFLSRISILMNDPLAMLQCCSQTVFVWVGYLLPERFHEFCFGEWDTTWDCYSCYTYSSYFQSTTGLALTFRTRCGLLCSIRTVVVRLLLNIFRP